MKKNVFLCAIAAAMTVAAADLPYVGTWKLNAAKSDFAGTTVTYTNLPSGEWQSTADGQTYKFKMDGTDYSDGMGDTAAWKPTGANSWQIVWKLNGKVLTTDSLQVGADGGSLMVNSKGTKPNGDAIDDTTTYQRVSGGPGLAGKWKTKNLKSSSPAVLELTASANDGMSFRESDIGLSCNGKLDGKDYPCTGPTIPHGFTVAMSKADPRSMDFVVKKDGKPIFKGTYSVGADGKSMTETGGATATNEKVKVVWDRQ
jgi:hypothetical protein